MKTGNYSSNMILHRKERLREHKQFDQEKHSIICLKVFRFRAVLELQFLHFSNCVDTFFRHTKIKLY